MEHARVRTTEDVDVLLMIPQLRMPAFFELLKERGFFFRFPQSMLELRDDGYTALAFEGVLVDLMMPKTPSQARVLDRSVKANILNHQANIASVDGLIVMKLMADRLQDWADIESLIQSNRNLIDVDFVRSELQKFALPDDPRWAKFEELLAKAR